jgi:hypothetical protein
LWEQVIINGHFQNPPMSSLLSLFYSHFSCLSCSLGVITPYPQLRVGELGVEKIKLSNLEIHYPQSLIYVIKITSSSRHCIFVLTYYPDSSFCFLSYSCQTSFLIVYIKFLHYHTQSPWNCKPLCELSALDFLWQNV